MEGYKSDALYQMQINIKYDPEYTEEKEIQKFVNLVSISHFRQQKIICKNNDKIYLQNKSINIMLLNT